MSYYFYSYIFLFVFFFKQKTAYEMRISDWSSDVCSSDLRHGWMLQEAVLDLARADAVAARRDDVVVAADEAQVTLVVQAALVAGHQPVAAELGGRGLRIAPVFEKHHRIGPADGDGAGSACR